MKQKLLSGLLVAVFAVAIAIPAFAASVMTIDVEPDVKVYVDDAPIDAGETHGNPEAFIYNGTTYIAAKAVSLSLGENVKWDGSTRSVYIGKHEGSSYYLMDVCPPYQMEGEHRTSVRMADQIYPSAIALSPYECALFNLQGKYDTLSFDVGHVDGRSLRGDAQFNIYLDGELVFTAEHKAEQMPAHYEVSLNGALQLKITGGDSYGYDTQDFALANVRVS